ncbi:MAG: FAD-dependent monooxygenase [Sphingomonadaceae bacterium]|nr:FAD-dependent monooxygenase [Sphingomonadaceae bacterium]
MSEVDVVISGAGPVGTLAAYALAKGGVSVLVAEAGEDCAEDLRASTFHPPTLEMLDQLGIYDELSQQGLIAPIYQYRLRSTGEVIAFDLSELGDMTRFPFRLQAEQFKLSRMLVDRLAGFPSAKVLFQHRLVHFEQDDEGVTVSFETPTDISKVRSKFLIAADGANSIVRKWLGVQFSGFTYPEKFLCLSTDFPIEEHFNNLALVNYVADAEEWLVLLRVPSLWRVLLPADAANSDEALRSDANKDKIFHRLLGNGSVETAHRTIYRVHQRVADRYDHGRVILAGDSAHLNNPLGGLGMNSGIHDAVNLTERLVRIILDKADASSELAHYDRQRRKVMNDFVQAQTIQNKQMLEQKGSLGGDAKYEQMRELNRDPVRRREYLLRQSMFTSLADADNVA